MSAFNSHDFSPPGLEQDSYVDAVDSRDPSPLLFTAKYSTNRITLLFSDRVLTASTTTSNYTLTGPSAPAISSVVYTSGARRVDLYLSGALSLVSTYTIAIADRAIASYNDASGKYQGFSVNNQSGLVVTVILPTSLSISGVGIEQDIVLGSPSVNTAGNAQAVGIEQDIVLGTPFDNTLVAVVGVGVAQAILLGSPTLGLDDVITPPGIAQIIALGTPVATLQQEPVGVGVAQAILLGTPVADANPEPFSGIGINQSIPLGIPVSTGSGNVRGVGIPQPIVLGAMAMSATNRLIPNGIGIEQDIALGSPTMSFDLHLHVGGVGISVDLEVGAPHISTALLLLSLSQAAGFPDLDAALQKAFGDGTSGSVNPDLLTPIPDFKDKFTTLQQHQTKLVFEEVAAAILASTGIPGILPTTGDTDSTLVATPTGTNQLTWIDGILTGSTEFDIE